MEKIPPRESAKENPAKSGLLAKFRGWIKSHFGRKYDPESRVRAYSGIREEIHELKPKEQKQEAPKVSKQETVPPSVQKIQESKPTAKSEPAKDKPTFKIKPKKVVRDLNRMSDEEFAKRLTGETHLEDGEIQRIVNPSAKDLAAKNEPPKDIRPTLKDYPAVPQDELDLHGKKAVEAEKEIRLFVLRAKRLSRRLVRIITGKGLHSEEGQSVLREVAERKATELKREGLVFGIKWEKGGGALLVYLT